MQQTLFDIDIKTVDDISNPDTYKGIYSFHKYWGKKPIESIVYFIQNFTKETDIVLDPFLGTGLISNECLSRHRRFIGIDLNPFSIEHTNFTLELPKANDFFHAYKEIEKNVRDRINQSYTLENNKIASHYLWNNEDLLKVWIKQETGRNRIELEPTIFDLENIKKYSQYSVRNIRKINFFTNSRINSKTTMTINDLFTRRALRNIDILLDEINKYSHELKRALLLTLTSSSGQMSTMVFAVTGRGKTKNQVSEKIEVGSWVIGFWRPKLHFEINVWNCFERRAKKLFKTLLETKKGKYNVYNSIDPLLKANNGASIINGNCLKIMHSIPNKTIQLICTDPPHSDRIPYLELSELWNSILNKNVSFEDEIIVSNAKERNKKKSNYLDDMKTLIRQSSRILKDDGLFLLYYNARDKQSWQFMELLESTSDLQLVGSFPMEYSANSVVQDNRFGGMKNDYVLVMKHKEHIFLNNHKLNQFPGWVDFLPKIKAAV